MPEALLTIHWWYGTEYVSIPAKDTAARLVDTLERWRSGISVRYAARLESFNLGRKKNTLVLRYVRDDQIDERTRDPNNEVHWGTSEITWQSKAGFGTAKWTDDEGTYDEVWSGVVNVDVLGEEASVDEFRNSVSVIVKARPSQQALRDQLRCLDKYCAISGEQEAAAIEAAHIVPVKAGGQEVISNAFLLRADIHRLFDAGLFWFELSADHAYVKHVAGLSQQYQDLLTDKSLPKPTFQRVAQALRLRSELPDGNGPRGN